MKTTAPMHGHEPIPWSVHLRIYDGYVKRFRGGGQSAERIAERGGFGIAEADEFYPQWREQSEEIRQLRTKLATAASLLREAMDLANRAVCLVNSRKDYRELLDELEQIEFRARAAMLLDKGGF